MGLNKFGFSAKCFLCNSKVTEDGSTLQYKYENNQTGSVNLCKECTNYIENQVPEQREDDE